MPSNNLSSAEMNNLIAETRKRIERNWSEYLAKKIEVEGLQVKPNLETGEIDDINLVLAQGEDLIHKLSNIADTLALLSEIQKLTTGEQ